MVDGKRKAPTLASPKKTATGLMIEFSVEAPSKHHQPSSPAQTKNFVESGLIIVRYADHVVYSRSLALAVKPQIREAVGWLVYECEEYITIAWDRDVEPPTLNGNGKASGLVIRKADILEMRKLG